MTTLVHNRLRIKHALLRLQITNPGLHKALRALQAALFIAAIAGTAYLIMERNERPVSYASQFKVEIKTYSLNGTVTEYSGKTLTLNYAQVVSENGSNKVTSAGRKVEIAETTTIAIFNPKNLKAEPLPASAADIQAGKSIAVYTSDNPDESGTLTASKIEIIK